MKLETLEKIEQEIAAGKLGIARDRLHGLISTYPSDLDLRSRLGDVYWQLGYKTQAGRFWFFDPLDKPHRQEAVARFLESCQSDPRAVLHHLRLERAEAGLRAKASERFESLLGTPLEQTWIDEAPPKPRETPSAKLLAWGCSAILIVMVLLIMVGLSTVASWIFG